MSRSTAGRPSSSSIRARRRRPPAWLTRAGVGTKRPLVAIAPGAAHATKRWPVQHWIKLVRQIANTGADVVALGGPGDSAMGAEIAARGRHPRGERGRRPEPAGDRRAAQAGRGAHLRRHRRHAHGHRRRHSGRRAVRADGAAVRLLSLQRPRRASSSATSSAGRAARHGGDACPLQHHLCMREIQPDMVFATLTRTLAT